MLRALRGALTLALLLVVLQIFLPELGSALIELLLKMVEIALAILNQVPVQYQ